MVSNLDDIVDYILLEMKYPLEKIKIFYIFQFIIFDSINIIMPMFKETDPCQTGIITRKVKF